MIMTNHTVPYIFNPASIMKIPKNKSQRLSYDSILKKSGKKQLIKIVLLLYKERTVSFIRL